MLVTKIYESETIESQISVVDKPFLVFPQKLIPSDEFINIVVVSENCDIHLAEERIIYSAFPDRYFDMLVEFRELLQTSLGSSDLILDI